MVKKQPPPSSSLDRDHRGALGNVEAAARHRLKEQCAYAYYFRDLTFHYADGVLTLQGCVASFYLKQVLQTLLRGLDGVSQINNEVHVVSSNGLSDVQPK